MIYKYNMTWKSLMLNTILSVIFNFSISLNMNWDCPVKSCLWEYPADDLGPGVHPPVHGLRQQSEVTAFRSKIVEREIKTNWRYVWKIIMVRILHVYLSQEFVVMIPDLWEFFFRQLRFSFSPLFPTCSQLASQAISDNWLVGSLVGWSADWLVGRLVGW